ncbi:tail fiber protein [Chondromyces apiculatus]
MSQYNALFSLLGTTYGGDGKQTFKLPKLSPLAAAEGTIHDHHRS